jgi:hypothetical protein
MVEISQEALRRIPTKDLEYYAVGQLDKMSTSSLEMLSGQAPVDRSVPMAGYSTEPSQYQPTPSAGRIGSGLAQILSGGSRKSFGDTGMARVAQPPLSTFDKIVGGAETGLSLATAIPSVIGGYAGLADRSLGRDAEERFVKGMERMTYAPRTEAGQRMLERTADFLTPLQAIAPMTEISALSRARPVSGTPFMPKSETISQVAGVTKEAAKKAIDVTKPASKFLTEPFRAVKAGLYDPVVNQQDIIASTLATAIGKEKVPNVIKGLERQAQTPNVRFSAAQATGNPALAAIEDTLTAINPSGELNLQAARNRAELAKNIRSLAQDEFAIDAAKQARTRATEGLYKSLEDVVVSGGDELTDLLARANAAGALQEAEKIAKVRNPRAPFSLKVVDEPDTMPVSQVDLPTPFETVQELPPKTQMAKEPLSLSGYLRKTGGVSQDYMLDITGEKNPRKSGATVGLFNKKARSMDDAVVRAVEGDYLPASVLDDVDGGVAALSELLATEIQQKQKVYPMSFDAYAQEMTAQYNQTPQNVTRMIGEPSRVSAPLPPENVIGQAIKGRDLINLKKGIDQAIKKTEPNSPLYTELLNLKQNYMDWLDSQGKGFLEANNTFAEKSKPINQMQVGKILSEKLIPATAEEYPSSLNAAQLARALKNKDEIARKVTGMKGAKLNKILTQKQLDTILGINSDASRMAEVKKLGAGYGSATARRLNVTDFIGENFKRQAPVTSKFIEILNATPIVGYATKGVSTAGSFVGKRINANISAELERLLANDPLGIANALKREADLINKKKIKVDFRDPIRMEAGLLGATPAATQPLQQFQGQ